MNNCVCMYIILCVCRFISNNRQCSSIYCVQNTLLNVLHLNCIISYMCGWNFVCSCDLWVQVWIDFSIQYCVLCVTVCGFSLWVYVCRLFISYSLKNYCVLFLPEVNARGAPNSEVPWSLGYLDMELRSGTLDGWMDRWMDREMDE